MPQLLEENGSMKAKISQLENELSIVQWYLEIMEGGSDTKQIVLEFAKLKREYKVLEQETSKKIE